VARGSEFRELRLVIGYAVIAFLWFFISDQVFLRLAADVRGLTFIQTTKDILFVGVTTALLYFLLHRELQIRQRAKDTLAEERDFATALLDTTPSLIMLMDQQGKVVQINRAFEAATGYSLNDLWGREAAAAFLPPRDHQRWQQTLKALAGGQRHRDYEGALLTKGGGAVRLSWIFTALSDTQGVVGTGTVVVD